MVALLAEGVDRNTPLYQPVVVDKVALLAEGVDRNILAFGRYLNNFCRPPRGGRG